MIEIKHKSTGKVLHTVDGDSLRGCRLKCIDLRGADFQNQDLSKSYLSGCSLSEADLRTANLSNTKILNCVAQRTDFTNANLSNADLSDNVLDVSRFVKVNAKGCKFRHAKINGADFSEGNLDGTDFFFSELRSNFTAACLIGANLFGADMCNADFTRADLRKSIMTDCKILGAKFEYAKLQGSIGTNGHPWGFSSKNLPKKQWWKIWSSAAS
ncbi:MAG: pentapeptide repeat-containing protein [Mariniblastus sp.]|nr:pentapeptide repeat-containing protein [Mariniblastus sp.]